jgi:2-dehydro-3-deoxyphosphogalactonate aldolase
MANCQSRWLNQKHTVKETLKTLLKNPVIAILRGVTPDIILPVSEVLIDAGFKVIEIPLNSPSALTSIELLAKRFGSETLVGAGTVLTVANVDDAISAGVSLILSPNRNQQVIERTVWHKVVSMPGVATPSEGFEALAMGADALKLFPSDVLGSLSVKAWRAVFPQTTPMFCVGGIDAKNIGCFRSYGATGIGLGSSLYTPSMSLLELADRAKKLLFAWHEK